MNWHQAVLAAVVVAVWLGRLYFWPFSPCRRCKGTGRNVGSTRKRFGMCGKCDGSGRRRRMGSKTVHRAVVALVTWKKED